MSTFPLAIVGLTQPEGVVTARRLAREAATALGLDEQESTRIATAISELARNAHHHGRRGQLTLALPEPGRDRLICMVADGGPGIPDVPAALLGRRRPGDLGTGLGLIGVQRLVDDLTLTSSPAGTTASFSRPLPVAFADDPARLRTQLSRRISGDAQIELQQQNQELLLALGELRIRQDELVALNHELDDTNRGVVALHHELDQQAERLIVADERKSSYLAGLTHELRSPLNSIVALTDLLSDQAHSDGRPLSEEQRQQVGFIRTLADRQLKLVGDLLDIAKIEAGRVDLDLRPTTVTQVFSLLRAQFRPIVADAVTLDFTAAPSLPELCTDEDKLLGVLGNLLANALRHTERGQVLVSAKATDGELMCFDVTDTGVGVGPGDLHRIFNEFERIESRAVTGGRGTGLGLPLAQKLAGILGGELSATSTLGQGSTFTLQIPVRHAGLVPGERPVLVVDAVDQSRSLFSTLLSPLGWTTIDAATAFDALDVLGRQAVAIVILDGHLPSPGSLELLKEIRSGADAPGVPIVMAVDLSAPPIDTIDVQALHAEVLDKTRITSGRLLHAMTHAVDRLST